MAIIRAYTTIEQSRKLAEILPLESADMWYSIVDDEPFVCLERHYEYEQIPCWSLAALLDVIPKCICDYNIFRMDINDKDFSIWYDEIGCGVNNKLPDITMKESIDACYEMILKLKELNLL